MKIPFSIDYRPQIESGEYKVVTRDGHPARIICWDSPIDKNRPIIGIVYYDQIEQYKVDGHYDNDFETSYDLFLITPEPELSEFEKSFQKIISEWQDEDNCPYKKEMSFLLHKDAAELLDLARKEIMDGWSRGLRDTQSHSGKAYNDGYQLGLENGKAEALKDLPRWNRLYSKENADKIPDCIIPGKALDNRLVHRGFELKVTDLEKLPGFKED